MYKYHCLGAVGRWASMDALRRSCEPGFNSLLGFSSLFSSTTQIFVDSVSLQIKKINLLYLFPYPDCRTVGKK